MAEKTPQTDPPTPVPISEITIIDPATGETVLTQGSGTLSFTTTPFLTPTLIVLNGKPKGSGLKPPIPYTVYFKEGDYQMQLQLLTFVPVPPTPPYTPPYPFAWAVDLPGGVAVTDVSVFDNIADHYAIKDAAGTFYQAGGSGDVYFMTLMEIDTSSGRVVNGGPAYFRNCSITYTEKNNATGKDHRQTLSELLLQAKLSDTLFMFQQIGAGKPPGTASGSPPQNSKDGGFNDGKDPPDKDPSQTSPDNGGKPNKQTST